MHRRNQNPSMCFRLYTAWCKHLGFSSPSLGRRRLPLHWITTFRRGSINAWNADQLLRILGLPSVLGCPILHLLHVCDQHMHTHLGLHTPRATSALVATYNNGCASQVQITAVEDTGEAWNSQITTAKGSRTPTCSCTTAPLSLHPRQLKSPAGVHCWRAQMKRRMLQPVLHLQQEPPCSSKSGPAHRTPRRPAQ